jgi:hypothetical protein
LRIDDANIDSIMDSHDSLFSTNIQNSLALGKAESSVEITNQGKHYNKEKFGK